MEMNKSSMSPFFTKSSYSSSSSAAAASEAPRMQRFGNHGDHHNILVRPRPMPKAKKIVEVSKVVQIEESNIDECAEAFIKRFRTQLQIQRLESIENYEKMMARGL